MNPSFPFNPTAVNGVGSWYNPLTWEIVTGYDESELQEKSRELDAQLASMNQEAYSTGRISQETYEQTVAHLAEQVAATESIDEEMNRATVEGLVEGYRNELAVLEAIPAYAGRLVGDVLGAVTRGVTRGVGSAGTGILGALPWWVWVGGAAALFIYFGGHQYVARRARAALSK